MPFDQSSHSCGRPAHAATLPARHLPRFTASQLISAVRKILEGTSTKVDLDFALTSAGQAQAFPRIWRRSKTPPTIGLSVGGVTVAVTGHDRSAFEAEDLVRLDVNDWPGGRAEIALCPGHVEVSEVRAAASREVQTGFARANAVTLVAAAVSYLVDAVGVVWHASLVCLPKNNLQAIAGRLTTGKVPSALWLGILPLIQRDGQLAGLRTRGLLPSLGAEIGIDGAEMSRSEAVKVLLGFAGRFVSGKALPEQMSALVLGARHKYRVRNLQRVGEDAVPEIFLLPPAEHLVAGAA